MDASLDRRSQAMASVAEAESHSFLHTKLMQLRANCPAPAPMPQRRPFVWTAEQVAAVDEMAG